MYFIHNSSNTIMKIRKPVLCLVCFLLITLNTIHQFVPTAVTTEAKESTSKTEDVKENDTEDEGIFPCSGVISAMVTGFQEENSMPKKYNAGVMGTNQATIEEGSREITTSSYEETITPTDGTDQTVTENLDTNQNVADADAIDAAEMELSNGVCMENVQNQENMIPEIPSEVIIEPVDPTESNAQLDTSTQTEVCNIITTDSVPGSTDQNVELRYYCTEDEYNTLLRAVEAEVTGPNPKGVSDEAAKECKIRVAQVILNRVDSGLYPDTINGVVFQKNPVQFSTTADGRFYSVEVCQTTIDAVNTALRKDCPDYTGGNADMFSSGNINFTNGKKVLGNDQVGHSFFVNYKRL